VQTVGQKADDAQRYRTILESAARVICAREYDGASMQDIAEGTVDLFFGGLQPSRS
jgi:AcrR family transcriptional regulator